ncbi:MAG: A/G-specific adenine glycosylase [Aromatoleum sp.]|jgi:A/G-specific adenine glycosylase|uniref:A/G-specific adenine glycosylase n=1 Tax=Aromatoleum sp. TaxID=2307007 RepID=UPI002895E66E|nr:A/G-specific adenine glycosylase [Aromatoleum sp.]MDT3672385.1 A/G-specific adenine glycosylase [Aromatoleum sp.]
MNGRSDFAQRLIDWHRDHGRHDLPWQRTNDPYRVWLSEIMLQQTQVDTVIPYYARFLARFPDIAALAAAPLDDVLALWSGLGYYARARNLHKAARAVIDDHGGCFPSRADGIAELPGIGRSTAAAIAAFSFGERAAILDGNVKRVLCRAFGVDGFPGERTVETRLWELAESLLPAADVGTYIQAQMDLGATVCTRGRPACDRCPLAESCVARREDRVASLPAARPRKAVPQRHVRVAVIQSDGRVLLERRPPAGIWGGLLALPEIPESETEPARWLEARFGVVLRSSLALPPLHHAFTHFRLEILPIRFEVGEGRLVADDTHRWLALADLDSAGLPTPVRRILDGCFAAVRPGDQAGIEDSRAPQSP